jgi:hypothetical protein
MIPAELPCLRYEEDSRHTERPSGSLEPHLCPYRAVPSYYIIELELCIGISEVDVCVLQPGVCGLYIGVQGRFHHLRKGGFLEVDGRTATTWP